MSGPRSSVATGDLVAGGLTIALGVVVLLTVRGYPGLPGGGPGPALFPGILAGLLILFGAVLAVRSLRRRTPDAAEPADQAEPAEAPVDAAHAPARPGRRRLLNAGAVLLAVVAYILLADLLGFGITMAVLLVGLMLLLGARPLVAVGASVVTTALVFVVFARVLLVPLPIGPLGF